MIKLWLPTDREIRKRLEYHWRWHKAVIIIASIGLVVGVCCLGLFNWYSGLPRERVTATLIFKEHYTTSSTSCMGDPPICSTRTNHHYVFQFDNGDNFEVSRSVYYQHKVGDVITYNKVIYPW